MSTGADRTTISREAGVARALALADAPAARHVFTQRFDASARAAARAADAQAAAGVPLGPLAGLPVSIKDLFDVAGEPTWAGARLRHSVLPAAPAAADAAVVARLRAAGAALIGKTNMTEFAFSGIGVNPHFGTPHNAADDRVPRIPGGSSSGAAVAVALGLCVAGIGSDTGGSIRVPAALNGIVGFKNTQSRTPLAGAFPLSHTLDTACAMARSVADCLVVDGVLSGAPLQLPARPLHSLRLLVPSTLVLDGLDPTVARAFERTLARLSAAGATLVHRPLAELAEVARINTPGGLVPMEAWHVHEAAMLRHRDAFDPRVAARIAQGEGASAVQYIRLLQARQDWIARMRARLADVDALICPTTPLVAPPIAQVANDEAEFVRVNGLMLRNTFPINFLDGCAFSLPCHAPDELPVGLMLAACGGEDAALAAVALAVEAALQV